MYSILIQIILLIGIFLFGITLMRIGIKGLTFQKLESITPKLSPVNGLWLGLGLTMILQSSSASIALLITFLATLKVSFPFAIFYLIGANIGTTFTAQLFVWNETHLMFLCLIIGLICLFIPKPKFMLTGAIAFGLGVIFSALNGFENLVYLIPPDRLDMAINAEYNSPLSLSIFGMFFTMIIQSSTVATGVLMSFSHDGSIPLIQIYYVLIGANIGTCFTVYLVSISQPLKARITAYAHIWMNVIGALIAFPLFVGQPIVEMAKWLSNIPEQQVVWIAVLYNIFTGIIFIVFMKPFIQFLKYVHRYKENEAGTKDYK
ncbi:Na/Pi symporter [Aquisalibacillus elongatus]|uniref:Phosphate:Na+ symporter n=1 Tax=Aquisalibacillus elongatus TaxID=485577 RepID=A0A3N5BDS6_9BACI|nr:Na/Pi symporter [Aquisalibacillus elongatus]RPF55587.1 phosphate:Na+ symporter [Aquisalibacillus elongatus]